MRCLDEEDIKELMLSDAYLNKYNQKHKQTVKNIEQGFQNLYPNDDRNSEPKQYYVWHSVGDEKTRSSHEERDGLVFRAFDNEISFKVISNNYLLKNEE